jgi:hypothetical protein
MVRTTLARILGTVAIAVAAALAAPAAPALAAPPGGVTAGPMCWTEADIYQQGDTVIAYAIKDCTNLDAPIGLSLQLQVFICDPGHCFWPPVAIGTGTVHAACSPGPMRNSRLPGKEFHCK